MNELNLTIYGPVVDSSWWNDGVTTPKQVQDTLQNAGNVKQINVHINSPGGSVFAGQAIHNMLKNHAANVTVYIDGLAASIASIIAMAGDKIVMPPGAMMMIHNPLLTMYGSYMAAEMRETADFLDKVKESLVATYTARQTKRSKDEIVALMDATTWMTAADAVENGFADEVDSVAVAANVAGNVLNIAGRSFDLSPFGGMPLNLVASAETGKATAAAPAQTKNEEEEILDLKELQAKHPDLYNEVIGLGVTKERERMKALDNVQLAGFEKIIDTARYDTGATAEQVAVQIIAAQKLQGADYLKNVQEDVKESNVAAVAGAAAPEGKEAEEQEIQAASEKMAAAINEGRE